MSNERSLAPFIRVCLIDFYLDWVNNYLTVEKMAEHYSITEEQCSALIDTGRDLHREVAERFD